MLPVIWADAAEDDVYPAVVGRILPTVAVSLSSCQLTP
jgi:hypothetical protein